MNDERMQPLLEAWFKDREATPHDVRHSTSQVMARLPAVRQRGRWWPLPTFDRPVSTSPSRELAPAPIPATNGRQPAGGFTMFSALKFVAAGVIVALFGGLLIAGVLTTHQGDEVLPAAVSASPTAESEPDEVVEPPDPPPSPVTTEESLSGFVTEEVEPGVLRIISDGVRDLTSVQVMDIVAGYDEGIWLLQRDGFLRLGSDGFHDWPVEVGGWPAAIGPESHVFEVAPDGTMWVIPRSTDHAHLDDRSAPGLRSIDGEEWTVEPCPGDRQSPACRGFTVAPDGKVWVTWREDDGRWRVGHLGPTGWQPLDGYARNYLSPTRGYRRLFFTDDGDIYGVEYEGEAPFRYADGDWTMTHGAPDWGGYPGAGQVGVGRDGTVWHGEPSWIENDPGLYRLADGEWAHWSSADLPEIRFGLSLDRQLEVAPDGSLWFSLWMSADGTDPRLGVNPDDWDWEAWVKDGRLVCDGLSRFDGETLDRFLPGHCTSIDIAPDGSVWVLATDEMLWVYDDEMGVWVLADDEEQSRDLYVITPEAVAASA